MSSSLLLQASLLNANNSSILLIRSQSLRLVASVLFSGRPQKAVVGQLLLCRHPLHPLYQLKTT